MDSKRKAKLIVNKSGNGTSNTFRATIPQTFIRKMGLGEDERDIEIEFDEIGEEIKIKKFQKSAHKT